MINEIREDAHTRSLFRALCLICNEFFNHDTREGSIFTIPVLWNDSDYEAQHLCKKCSILIGELRPLKLKEPKIRYPNCKHPKDERVDYDKYYFCSKCHTYVTYQKTIFDFIKK